MENKIPTVEEIIKTHYDNVKNHFYNFDKSGKETYEEYAKRNPLPNLNEAIIEFAKLHVEAALKVASENAKWSCTDTEISFGDTRDFDFKDTDYAGDPCTGYNIFVDKNSILNAYPLDLIK